MRSCGTIESDIILAALGNCPSPPVDLHRVAKAVGVGDVILVDIWNGSTDFSYVHPIIYLNRSDSEIKRRFVFAHELAHVMLRMPQVISLIQAHGQMRLLADEEQLADRIGATLLLPDSWITTPNASRVRAARLTEMAMVAEVSLAALIRRMSTAGIDVAMLHWVKGDSNWHVIDRPGAPVSLRGSVKPSMIGYWTIENVGPGETDIVIDCRINGWPAKISGSSFRDGSAVLQVIQPSCGVLVSKYNECVSFDYHGVPDERRGWPVDNQHAAKPLVRR